MSDLYQKFVSVPYGDFKRKLEREHDLTAAPEMKQAIRIDEERDRVLTDPNIPDSRKYVRVQELKDELLMWMNKWRGKTGVSLSSNQPSNLSYDSASPNDDNDDESNLVRDLDYLPKKIQRKAKAFLDRVPLKFDGVGQLVVNGTPIIGSNRAELADYVAGDWVSKYGGRNRPPGSEEIHRVIREHNISKVGLGKGVVSQLGLDKLRRPIFAKDKIKTTPKEMFEESEDDDNDLLSSYVK